MMHDTRDPSEAVRESVDALGRASEDGFTTPAEVKEAAGVALAAVVASQDELYDHLWVRGDLASAERLRVQADAVKRAGNVLLAHMNPVLVRRQCDEWVCKPVDELVPGDRVRFADGKGGWTPWLWLQYVIPRPGLPLMVMEGGVARAAEPDELVAVLVPADDGHGEIADVDPMEESC